IFFFINKTLYGSWLGSGYLSARGADAAAAGAAIQESLLPFGFNLLIILRNIWRYFFGLFPALGIAYVVGAFYFGLKVYLKDATRAEKLYFGGWLWASFALFIYYGSGVFLDTPDREMFSPATSYFRYWLPIYVFGLPLALGWVVSAFKIFSKNFAKVVMPAIFLFYAVNSFVIVFFTPGDGLVDVNREIFSYRDIIAQTEALVPPGSVIIVHKADKIFFPQWPVALYDDTDNFYDTIAKVRKEKQVFYFRPGPTPKEQFHIYYKFAERNLAMKRVVIMGKNVLYEIK
ncbi:MAG: hypothetical protein AAB731_04430, partial [Patescibacteria group bacterium]